MLFCFRSLVSLFLCDAHHVFVQRRYRFNYSSKPLADGTVRSNDRLFFSLLVSDNLQVVVSRLVDRKESTGDDTTDEKTEDRQQVRRLIEIRRRVIVVEHVGTFGHAGQHEQASEKENDRSDERNPCESLSKKHHQQRTDGAEEDTDDADDAEASCTIQMSVPIGLGRSCIDGVVLLNVTIATSVSAAHVGPIRIGTARVEEVRRADRVGLLIDDRSSRLPFWCGETNAGENQSNDAKERGDDDEHDVERICLEERHRRTEED